MADLKNKSEKTPVAYFVQGDEYGVPVFATSNVVARREGANELDEPFGAVSCKRLPEADKYIDDPRGLRKALVEEMGYWQECGYCQAHVDESSKERLWKDDAIFCGKECFDKNEAWFATLSNKDQQNYAR